MIARIASRLLMSAFSLFVIALGTFFLMHSIPGGPFDTERALPKAVEANLRAKFHLDDPLSTQFVDYMNGLVHGDLGPSFQQADRTTNDIIREGFPKSAILGITAFLFAFAVGLPLGLLSALSRRGVTDRSLLIVAVLGVSVPSFILASLLQYLFSFKLGLAPASGWGESPWQIILPALSLAGFPVAFISRLVRTSMLAILDADFIRTARAKGLSAFKVIGKHALRNALLPVVTYAGPLLAALVTGSFVVENIFAIPGLGQFFVISIDNRDYTVIMGVTLFYSTLLIAANLLVDTAYIFLDPRISAENA
jgi:oligopeptide transport system permease protein